MSSFHLRAPPTNTNGTNLHNRSLFSPNGNEALQKPNSSRLASHQKHSSYSSVGKFAPPLSIADSNRQRIDSGMHSVDNRDIVPPGNFEEEEDVGFFCFGYLGTDVEKAENLYFKKEDHALKRTEFLATQQYQNQSDRRSTVWRKSAYYANNN